MANIDPGSVKIQWKHISEVLSLSSKTSYKYDTEYSLNAYTSTKCASHHGKEHDVWTCRVIKGFLNHVKNYISQR